VTANLKIAMGLKEDCLTLEDGADRLSQNVGKKLPLYAAWNPQRVQISFTMQYKPETLMETVVTWKLTTQDTDLYQKETKTHAMTW
jgi:hypothetical protein